MFIEQIKAYQQESIREQQTFITIAKVIFADELNNKCDLNFQDNYGQERYIKGVPYLLTDPKFSGYFPQKNEEVILQCQNNKNYFILGPYYKRENYIRDGLYKTPYNQMYFKDYAISEGSIL